MRRIFILTLLLFPIFLYAETAVLSKITTPTVLNFTIDKDIKIICHVVALASFSKKGCAKQKKFTKEMNYFSDRQLHVGNEYWLEEMQLLKNNECLCSITYNKTSYTEKMLVSGYGIYNKSSDLNKKYSNFTEQAKSNKSGLWGYNFNAMECYESKNR